MRKKILSITAIALTSGVLLFTGCSKDDVTAPEVTLNGASAVTIILNSTYVEAGATATDDKDGTITPVASGSVNTDLVGTYTITYTATDAAGNEGTAERKVTVRNEADIYAGEYTTTSPDTVWNQTITPSPTKNKAIVFSYFACRKNNNKITAILSGGTAFQLDGPQTGVGVGLKGCTFNYTSLGAGQTIVKTTGGKYSFSVKYTEARVQGGTDCPASGAASYEDVFVQK